MKNSLFYENRLIFMTPPNKPRSNAESVSEIPKGKMLPLAVKSMKDLLAGKNGLDAKKFSRAKGTPAKQRRMLTDWLKKHGLERKLKDNLFGTAKIATYYLDGKKVDPAKAGKELHKFLLTKTNRAKVMAEIRKERSQTATKSPETRKTFKESNRYPSQAAADKTAKFFQTNLQKLANKAVKGMRNVQASQKLTPKKLLTKLNKVINTYGANVGNIRANFGMDDIKFNGPVAWSNVKSARKRRKMIRAISKVV